MSLRKDDTCKIVKCATSLSNERPCCHSIQQYLVSWSSYSPFYAHTKGYVTRGRGGREIESRREQGKSRFQFPRRIYYTPKYLFHNKTKLQSDRIQKYGIGGVMNSNPVAYLLVMRSFRKVLKWFGPNAKLQAKFKERGLEHFFENLKLTKLELKNSSSKN